LLSQWPNSGLKYNSGENVGFINTGNFINPSTPELNHSAQRRLPGFLLGILIFKGLTVRRLCKSFGVKGLMTTLQKSVSLFSKVTDAWSDARMCGTVHRHNQRYPLPAHEVNYVVTLVTH
jgi:hypothetical protein